jgi:hypothetical protein
MDVSAGVYLFEVPSPPKFLFGVIKQFRRLGIWSNTLCITPKHRCSPHNLIPSPPVTHCINTVHTPVLILTGNGGGEGRSTSEKVRGALVHKKGRKYQHD